MTPSSRHTSASLCPNWATIDMVNGWGRDLLLIPIEETANGLPAVRELSPVVRSEVEIEGIRDSMIRAGARL
jgi:hypothetical protein